MGVKGESKGGKTRGEMGLTVLKANMEKGREWDNIREIDVDKMIDAILYYIILNMKSLLWTVIDLHYIALVSFYYLDLWYINLVFFIYLLFGEATTLIMKN